MTQKNVNVMKFPQAVCKNGAAGILFSGCLCLSVHACMHWSCTKFVSMILLTSSPKTETVEEAQKY